MVVFMVKNHLKDMAILQILNTLEFLTITTNTQSSGIRCLHQKFVAARRAKIITGLPDTYGRGRIVGDYRRVALYGIDYLMQEKLKDHANCGHGQFTEEDIRLREEISDQYKALKRIKEWLHMDSIFRPAENAKEAVQWTYFGYLAQLKNKKRCGYVYRTCLYVLRYLHPT